MTARNHLPNRRLAETFELEVAGLRYTATVGPMVASFLNNTKSNSAADTNARDSAIVCSIVDCIRIRAASRSRSTAAAVLPPPPPPADELSDKIPF
jgi:hypothetical protein